MAMTQKNNVVRFTADNDTYAPGLSRIRCAGARLVAAAATSTAQIKILDTNGQIVCSLTCVANTADECNIPFTVDGGTIFVDISGAGAEVFLYLE